jgi:hypothetical protein
MAYKKYTNAAAVTLHDTNVLTGFKGSSYDGVYIGVSGDVNMTLSKDSTAVVFKNMIQGTLYNISPKIILSTSTTATDVVVVDTASINS